MDSDENKLTELIYQTILEPNIWPTAVSGLRDALNQSHVNKATGIGEQIYLSMGLHQQSAAAIPREERLRSHLQQALSIHHKITELENSKNAAWNVINQLPIAVFFIDDNLNFIDYNNSAGSLLQNAEISISNNKFSPQSQTLYQDIRTFIHQNKQSKHHNSNARTITWVDTSGRDRSLLAMSIDFNNCAVSTSVHAVLVPPHISDLQLLPEDLQTEFNLTRKEAELASGLCNGMSLQTYADANQITVNTVKSQLRNLLSKTQTTRQVELVSKLAISASSLQPGRATQRPTYLLRPKPKEKEREKTITLSDGRQLAYCEYGVKHGYPIVFCHSEYGSRYERHYNISLLHQYNVRLIVPDRPGTGNSDFIKGKGYVDWTHDFEQLLDSLNLDRVAVTGYGLGCNFALACAVYKPLCVSLCSLISPKPPITSFSDLKELMPTYKLMMGIALVYPSLAEKLIRGFYKASKKDLRNQLLQTAKDKDEQNLLTSKEVIGIFQACCNEILKQDPIIGLCWELHYAIKPLNFPFENIKAPIHVFRGSNDHHIPANFYQRYASKFKHRLHILPDKGYFLLHSGWKNILEILKPYYCDTTEISKYLHRQVT